jgi:uncharacterized protein (DUF697 family)
MFTKLWSTVIELVDSKKFVTAFSAVLAALVVLMGRKFGIDLDPELSHWIAGTIMVGVVAYVHAQGRADEGKEAAKAIQAAPSAEAFEAMADRVAAKVLERVQPANTDSQGGVSKPPSN